jgi:phosphoribosylamine---glycine ligase
MNVLVVGSGAREHALVWKLAGERAVSEVVCAPGNAGIRALARCLPVDPGDPAALVALAERARIDLTIVGPELPLARGVADRFAAAGLTLFGPRREPARLESSKVYAKEFMRRHGVPTARSHICETPAAAVEAIETSFDFPLVVKADGLAAGKGVTVAADRASAEAAVRAAMVERTFGDAGARLVIEEHLQGQEVSLFAVCDGETALPLPAAQDHKRAFDEDRGPNTGGMGAFAPSRILTSDLQDRVMCEIVEPVLHGLRAEGHEFRGFLYVGLMLTGDGPKVVEFNVRLGDPEAQVVLPMIESDLAPLLLRAAADRLGREACVVREQPHVGVVLASAGYPGDYVTGHPIEGLPDAARMPDVLIFHAGTTWRDGQVVTAGGRVLTVVGRGATFDQAIERAYAAERVIRFEGKQARRDIGRKALAPAPNPSSPP